MKEFSQKRHMKYLINKIHKLFKIPFRIKAKKKSTPNKVKRSPLELQGDHHHLGELYSQVNDQYFEGKLDLHIRWTGEKHSLPRTRVLLGSFNHQKKLIRIHRRLDQSHIPRYFITFVIYHEMLHHLLPPITKWNERRKIHHLAFVEKERQFQDYKLVQEFNTKMKKTWFRK